MIWAYGLGRTYTSMTAFLQPCGQRPRTLRQITATLSCGSGYSLASYGDSYVHS